MKDQFRGAQSSGAAGTQVTGNHGYYGLLSSISDSDKYARDLSKDQADKFVGMYVNELTLDYGESGRQALRLFFDMAYEKKLIIDPAELDFITI